MNSSNPLVIVLVGPTASGKTKLAIEIAKHFNINIHNIDSRQIYKGMDIGTAKPTKEEQQTVKHYLLNLTYPDRTINVKEFQSIATKSINNEIEEGINPFLVGGSGLYMNSIINGFKTPDVPPHKSLRDNLEQLGQEQCWDLLISCDPITANKINSEDKIRTIRALEVFYATGEPISSLQSINPPPWNVLQLGLDKEDLNKRILKRTQLMFDNGIIEETETLINRYGSNLSLLKTIGYREASEIINKLYNKREAIDVTTQKTINFAKRQRTWFRNKNNPYWLNNKNPLKDAIIKIESAIC
tara:strand:+ start:370 stop:1269 length:900 start_codon:yes stop_codon:yes gene_type:complete